MPDIQNFGRPTLETPAGAGRPSPEEIIKRVTEANEAEDRARAKATAIILASVLVAAVAAGMLAHESALVSGFVFVIVCLLSVRMLVRYLI